MKSQKPGSNPEDSSSYRDRECPLTTFTGTHLIRSLPPTNSISTNSILKTHQTNGENIIISNIKRTMKNFVKAITNLTPHLGPKGAYFTLADSRGDDSDTSKPKPQTDSKFSTSSQT
jgi:hypothetical protein